MMRARALCGAWGSEEASLRGGCSALWLSREGLLNNGTRRLYEVGEVGVLYIWCDNSWFLFIETELAF